MAYLTNPQYLTKALWKGGHINKLDTNKWNVLEEDWSAATLKPGPTQPEVDSSELIHLI